MKSGNFLASAALLLIGALIGVGGYALFASCPAFSCLFPSTEMSDSGVLMKDVTVTYSIPDVGVIEELQGGEVELPADAAIPVPFDTTSETYVQVFNDLVNTGNKLEVQLRERLPDAMYAVQAAGQNGQIEQVLGLISAGIEENKVAVELTTQLEAQVEIMEGTLSEVDPAVAAASSVMLEKAQAVIIASRAFTDHTDFLLRPAPPTPGGLEKMGVLATTLSSDLEQFAISIRDAYGAIESATVAR